MPQQQLSPRTALAAIVVITGICVLGISHSPDALASQIIGFCSMSVIALIAMLRGEQQGEAIKEHAKALESKLDKNTNTTDDIGRTVQVIEKQTNGHMQKGFDLVNKNIDKKAEEIKQVVVDSDSKKFSPPAKRP